MGSVLRALAVVVLGTSVLGACVTPPGPPPSGGNDDADELLYLTEGNRLRRIDVDTIGTGALAQDVLVESAGRDPENGRDINGEICPLPDGSGGFVAGEDTGQPDPPAGWGIFDAAGTQVGKLTATYQTDSPEPFGCAFGPDGTLFTSDVGFQGFGTANGQLIQWFSSGVDQNRFCKLAIDLGTAGAVAVDQQGRVYVAQSSGLRIDRFSPPFPTGPDAAGGCSSTDATGAPMVGPDEVQREIFATAADGMLTFSGLATAPNGNIYAASVLTGGIAEYDLDGHRVRFLVEPHGTNLPTPTGNPQGIAVGADGDLYYADLDLVGALPDVGPGPNGKVRRIRFDSNGDPLPPQIVRQGLAFPDGVALLPGDLEPDDPPLPLEWPTLAGGHDRQFFNPDETALTPATAGQLIERWRFRTGAVVTSSPSVATVDPPGHERPKRLAFFTSWDGFVYAVDWATGAERWRFRWEDQPGAAFPAAGSPTIADVAGRRTAFVAAGETMYALDAATGAELWRFVAGTGCRDAAGNPPGLCAFDDERNQIETTPVVADGLVFFGMDVNDVPLGKGGFYAVDAEDGSLTWFFDPESGQVCRTGDGDEVRRYDGYHSEAELGLPAGFLATRPGCDAPRNRYGCGNIWSSAAYDPDRQLLIFGTSNCDTDDDPATPPPSPPMPPNDEAVVALSIDGTVQWRWRPREIDNDDLAFGAAPNLFSLAIGDQVRDVVGIGNKDGTYYVLDRDGRNARNGVAWDDADPSQLPYWQTNVVPGGEIGGVIQTAAVDEVARRVYFSTAPGQDVLNPQRPTVHALDMDTGAVVWQNRETDLIAGDASYGPTSAVPGVVIVGSVITPHLRMYDAADGRLLVDRLVGDPGTFSGVASGATVLDGTLIVGAGIGTRTQTGSSPGDFAANTPSAVVALCVPGTPGCTPPTIRPGVGWAVEGDSGTTNLDIPLTLSRPIGQPVTVEWSTAGLTARPGSDFVSSTGTVTFAPLQTSATIPIPVVGDTRREPPELLLVRLRNPTNAQLRLPLALGIILDDPGG